MLPARRSAPRLALWSRQIQHTRNYANRQPSDPMTSDRPSDTIPTSDSKSAGDSSHTESAHAASAGGHEGGHGHGVPLENGNESMGRGFYGSIAVIVSGLALYRLSRNSDSDDPNYQPFITRYINKLSFFGDEYEKRNILHTKAIEQAGHDKNLFQSSTSTYHVDLKFPEIFNTGSPRNNIAGQQANLDDLHAHYQKEVEDAEKYRIARMNREPQKDTILGHDVVPDEKDRRNGYMQILEAWGIVRKSE